jgi:hypothetical protein
MANKGCCIEWEQEIILYLDNELPESGRSRVEKHLRQCKYCAPLYREMERENQLMGGRLRHLAEAGMPASFTRDVMEALPVSAVITFRSRMKENLRKTNDLVFGPARVHLAVAASLLICLFGLFVARDMNHSSLQDTRIEIRRNGVVQQVAVLNPILVTYDQGEFFEFPDGSVAYATKGTLFNIESYQQGKDDKTLGADRQIKLLKGELFFDVQSANEGFNVICANSKTTVFGTQFYVGSSPEYRTTLVGVREGRVFVEKRGKNQVGSTVLNKRQMTRILNANGHIKMSTPEYIFPVLLDRLNDYNHALRDRKARGVLAKPGMNASDGILNYIN